MLNNSAQKKAAELPSLSQSESLIRAQKKATTKRSKYLKSLKVRSRKIYNPVQWYSV